MEEIGKKIKKLRLDNDFTLKELSERTELSVSFLSQIERGSTSIAITSLKKIADVFNLPMHYFFEEQKKTTYIRKLEHQEPFKIVSSTYTHIRLSGLFSNKKLEPMIVLLPPQKEYSEEYSHEGEEFYYILEGSVIFRVDDQEYYLKEGESIHFPSHKKHQWKNISSDKKCKMLCVLTPVIF